MITDIDKRLMNIEEDDELQIQTNLYKLHKDIKIDSSNLGIKSF
jgi:hypothetical protein